MFIKSFLIVVGIITVILGLLWAIKLEDIPPLTFLFGMMWWMVYSVVRDCK